MNSILERKTTVSVKATDANRRTLQKEIENMMRSSQLGRWEGYPAPGLTLAMEGDQDITHIKFLLGVEYGPSRVRVKFVQYI